MRKALALLGLFATLTACSGAPEEQPGDPGVYERIAELEDCAALQEQFDTAAANQERAESGSEQSEWSTAYMEAADERMREVGCY